MNPIEKTLRKFNDRERSWVEETIERVIAGDTAGLNIKKLRGRDDVFRIRKGGIRIIYIKKNHRVVLLFVGRRNEVTYGS